MPNDPMRANALVACLLSLCVYYDLHGNGALLISNAMKSESVKMRLHWQSFFSKLLVTVTIKYLPLPPWGMALKLKPSY